MVINAKNKYHALITIDEATPSFVRGRLDLDQAIKAHTNILKEVDNQKLQTGEIGSGDEEDAQCVELDTRQSSIYWLATSKKARAIAYSIAKQINDRHFKIPITNDPPDIQYTVYSDPNDHYDWHQDIYENDEDEDDEDFKRTLSLSLCLSADDFYEGAEFFIKDGSERNVRVFKMRFGEFIVFPSTVEHKVNALRAGERESLVIWYGIYKS